MNHNFFNTQSVWKYAQGNSNSQGQGQGNSQGQAQGQGQGQGAGRFVVVQEMSVNCGRGDARTLKVGQLVKGKVVGDSLETNGSYEVPTEKDYQYAMVDAACIISIPMKNLKRATNVIKQGQQDGVEKIKQQKEKLREVTRSPFAQGFKKYVVTSDFVGTKLGGTETKNFKVGMNLFAKEVVVSTKDGSIGSSLVFVSYAGYVLDKTKLQEKKKNVYERIQSFFNPKKGFA
jgi:hypothetical protein